MASEALEAAIAMMGELDLFTGNIEADRVGMTPGAAMPEGIAHEIATVGDCQAAWLAGERSDAALLYLHGGGYVMGGFGTHGGFGARLVEETGLSVLVVDYRLAPEHTYPAALDDALAGFDWLTAKGITANRIAIAGDSAGGGLTLATLAALRDRGVSPAAGVALSPWADLTCSNPSYGSQADADPLVGREALRICASAYAGDLPLDHPGLSPALGDLSGLPPVLVQVGGREVLLDDSTAVVDAINASGGQATLQTWDEAIHVFQILGAPESDDAIAKIAAFVGEHLD